MFFWILVSLVTTGIAVVLLLPLLRGGAPAGEHSHDVEVYKDQLQELVRDEAGGLISKSEAAYARAEIGRRLIAASEKASGEADTVAVASTRGPMQWFAIVLIVLVLPLVGIGLYRHTGKPTLPDMPLQERMANITNDEELLVATVETRLMLNPDDGKGWDLLAPIYVRAQRHEDAQNAFSNAIRLLGPSVARFAGLGESIVASQQGIVTDEARAAFQEVLKLDPNDPRSRFYIALALEQENKGPEALAAYEDLVRISPKDAPWLELVNQHIASLNGTAPASGMAANPNAPGNPSAADVAAAQDMSAGDRDQMIRTMVAGLDEKLKADPNNFEGWMRLVRSYAMLKDTAKAEDALTRGLVAFPASGDQGKALLAMAKELGVKTPEAAQ